MEKYLKKSPKFSTDYHCQAGGQNWLFCKTLVVGRLVRFCKCANVRLAKIVLKKCAMGKILKTFGPVCVSAWSYRVSLLKNAFKSVRLNCQVAKSPFFSRHFQGCTVFLRLGITVCRFAMGGIFSTNVYAEHKTFGYHKNVCGVRYPAYCKCAVQATPSVSFVFCY